jgi:hypothetical protein
MGGRTVLVIEDRPYLWAALQARVPRATAYVRAATPLEVAQIWESCRPWPWVVVGTPPAVPGLAELLEGRPIPVHWLAPVPPLPGRPTVHAEWQALVAAIEGLNRLGLGALRPLPNRGLRYGGRLVLWAPTLEGLLAAPDGLPAACTASARAELAANGLPLALEEKDGMVRLVPGVMA